MAASDRLVGTNLLVQFIHSGGTAEISGDYTTFTVTRDSQMADLTAGDDGGQYNKFLYQINSATLESYYDGTVSSASIGTAMVRGTEGTILYGPSGTATGSPKGGFPAVVKKADFSEPYDNAITLSFEFSGQGTELFNPAVDSW